MRTSHRALLVLPFVLAFHARALAGVIVVAADGTGAYTDLPAAIAAAADGDVLLVRTGTYSAFTITNKALDVVADAGATVVVQGGVSVVQLSATRAVTLTGLTLRGPVGNGALAHPALRLSDDAGSVRVLGCELFGADGPACTTTTYGGPAIGVTQCQDVALAHTRLFGGTGADHVGYAGYGGDGVSASGSRMALYDCAITAGVGGSSGSCGTSLWGYAGAGGRAGFFQACNGAFASRCSFQGGNSGLAPIPAQAGAAFRIENSAPTSILETTYAAGIDPSGLYDPPIVLWLSVSVFTTLTGTGRTLTCERVVREGHELHVALAGEPGDVVELSFAERGRFATSGAWRGVDLLRTEKPRPVMHAGVVGASGVLDVAWPIAELGPGVQARRWFLQAAFRDTSGVTTLSTPATLVLLDAGL